MIWSVDAPAEVFRRDKLNSNVQNLQLKQGILLLWDWWHFSHFFFLICLQPLLLLLFSSSSFLSPLFSQVLSNFSDLLPLLLQFCWPWNQFLMGTQWPRAGPTCCIQICPPAIISHCPTLCKHSFNNLSSYESAHFRLSDPEMLQTAATSNLCYRYFCSVQLTGATGRQQDALLTLRLRFDSFRNKCIKGNSFKC